MQFGHTEFRDAIPEAVRATGTAGTAGAATKPLGSAVYGSRVRAPETQKASANRSVTLLLIGGGEMYSLDTYKVVNQAFTLLLVGGCEWVLRAACRKLVECVAPLWRLACAEGEAR